MDSRVALITGASGGLGRAIALAFAKKKYAVGVHYFEDEHNANVTAQLVRDAGAIPHIFKADLRNSSDVKSMIDSIASQFGRIDVLVNNAGNAHNQLLARMTDDDWRDVFAVNLDAPFYLIRSVIPVMRKQGEGSIVNIASYASEKATRGAGNYSAAKSALVSLTKSAALEEGRHNIRVNAVMPGFHVTGINEEVWKKFEKQIVEQHVLGRLPDREEMASFVTTIAELKLVTGQVFAFESRL